MVSPPKRGADRFKDRTRSVNTKREWRGIFPNEYSYKVLNDPIHGPIGLSKLETELINTPSFQRLRRLNQLGLAHYTYPGATHTRFAHSIGVMYVISRMIDSLYHNSLKDGVKPPIDIRKDDGKKQKLRLAALLHDVGHYPLSHATEKVFWHTKARHRQEDGSHTVLETEEPKKYLHEMAGVKLEKDVSHERFGQYLVKNRTDIVEVLKTYNYDPVEIGKIFAGEVGQNDLYIQLIHSSFDADRLDYLLRDSHYTGVPFGKVDIEFLLSQLRYDKERGRVAVDYKGIPALEHYLIGRYFMYNNVSYHKTIVAFELMAQTLYYQMYQDTDVVGDYMILKGIACDDWLLEFCDDYFWRNLLDWEPADIFHRLLKENLLKRKPLVLLAEQRRLVGYKDKEKPHFSLSKQSLRDPKFEKLLRQYRIEPANLALVERKIEIESEYPFSPKGKSPDEEHAREFACVYCDNKFQDIIDVEHSIVHQVAEVVPHIRWLYYLSPDDKWDWNSADRQALEEKIRSLAG